MFKRNNELYTVGDIVIVCWTDINGINKQIRGRLIQVKTDLNRDLKSETRFVVAGSGKKVKNTPAEKFTFKLTNDIHVEKI